MSQDEARDRRDREIMDETRRRIKEGRFQDCPCTTPGCPRHGVCAECTAVHRSNRSSVPVCLRNLVERKLKDLAGSKT
jgi:hypothetical protein